MWYPLTLPLSIYIIYKKILFFFTGLLCGSEIPLNFTFNEKKTWEQLGKNISLTPLKMPIKQDILLLSHVFKTNLPKFLFNENYDTRPLKKKKVLLYMQSVCVRRLVFYNGNLANVNKHHIGAC